MHAQITYELLMIAAHLRALGYHHAAAAFSDPNNDTYIEFYYNDEARAKVYNEIFN